MGETGGPVYEGVGRPEAPRVKGVVEKVKQKAKTEISDFKNKGEFVEKKWVDAHKRIVDALDEGKRKQVLEKARWAFKTLGKIHRIAGSVIDAGFMGFGLSDVFKGMKGSMTLEPKAPSTMARGVIEVVLGKKAIARRASGFMADIVGFGGEKIAQITNKIFSGKPKAMAG